MCALHCTAFLYWDLQSQQISEKEVNLNNIFNIQVNRTILKNKLLLSIIYGTGEWGYFLDCNFLAEFFMKTIQTFFGFILTHCPAKLPLVVAKDGHFFYQRPCQRGLILYIFVPYKDNNQNKGDIV